LTTPIRSRQQLDNPSCVKTVFDHAGRALYFSRSPIPYVRDGDLDELLAAEPPVFFLHIGLYAYRRDFLLQLAKLPRSPLEQLESLEQLRVLTAGYHVQVGIVTEPTVGIDTLEDYQAFVRRMRNDGG
jgi:3-deoxy-manno-octulosonate cytidylyltransferase (CMP-KDO synthetase)